MKLGVVTGAVLLILQHAAATEIALDKSLSKGEAVQQSNTQIVVHETADTGTAEKGQRRVKRVEVTSKVCPHSIDKDFVRVGNTCYQFWFNQERWFAGAVKWCEQQHAHLMSLETDEKLQSVSKYVKETYPGVSGWRTTGRLVGNDKDWYWCIGCKGNTGKNVPIDGWPLSTSGPLEEITVILKKQADGNYKLARAQMGTIKSSQHQYPFACEAPSSEAKIDCIRPGYKYIGGPKCYKFLNAKANFKKGQRLCTQTGGLLAEPQTSDEMHYVKEYLQTITTSPFMWIGARRYGAGKDFRWMQFNKALAYTNWKGGKPGWQDCVSITKDGKWRANKCNLKYGLVCQLTPGIKRL